MNLRNEIEKIFEVHRLAGLSDYDFGIREEWEVIEWIDQILSLLEGEVKKARIDELDRLISGYNRMFNEKLFGKLTQTEIAAFFTCVGERIRELEK